MRLPELSMHTGYYFGYSQINDRPVYVKHMTNHQVSIALNRLSKEIKHFKVIDFDPYQLAKLVIDMHIRRMKFVEMRYQLRIIF